MYTVHGSYFTVVPEACACRSCWHCWACSSTMPTYSVRTYKNLENTISFLKDLRNCFRMYIVHRYLTYK